MYRFIRKNSAKIAMCLALLVISSCVILIGMRTLARYQWDFTQTSYLFTPASPESVAVYNGHLTQELIDGGRLPSASGIWERKENGATLEFSVANGSTLAFLQKEQLFTVCVAAGLVVEDPQQLTVTLTYADEESGDAVSVTGTPVAITEGTLLHNSFGDGWVYRFYPDDNELSFALNGGAFSYRNFTVTVTGSVQATLLDLQITELRAD